MERIVSDELENMLSIPEVLCMKCLWNTLKMGKFVWYLFEWKGVAV